MVTALVDTNILVDILRNYQLASQWFATQSQLGISRFVFMELVVGAPNQQKQRDALKFLDFFIQIPILDDDVIWAQEQLAKYHLSHQIGTLDCLIAASAHRLQVPFYTRNLKDFTPLLGQLARNPY